MKSPLFRERMMPGLKKFVIAVVRVGNVNQDVVAAVRKTLHDITAGNQTIPFESDAQTRPWDFDVKDCGFSDEFERHRKSCHLLIIVTDGRLDVNEIGLSKTTRVAFINVNGESTNPAPLASAFLPWPISTFGDVGEITRRLILRVRNEMRGYRFEPVASTEQIRDYLTLRYATWADEEYLRPELRDAKTQFEVDSLDRHAFPIGAWSESRKTMLGCVRLVYPAGKTSDFGQEISNFLKAEAPDLLEHLQPFPRPSDMAFDVLEALEGFRIYYQKLVTANLNIRLGEIGRVITNRRFRRKSIAYSLVETALQQARDDGLHAVFLACRLKHVAFYKRLGFSVLAGTKSDSFINGINQECVAMGHSLDETRVNQDTFHPVEPKRPLTADAQRRQLI